MASILRLFLVLGIAAALPAQTVRFFISEGGTPAGNIDVTLNPTAAPLTVANFLAYMNAGAYTNTVFHRSVPNFVIQSGGFQLTGGALVVTPANAAVTNEFKLSNVKGTIAMAQTSGDINSATNQWFFNTVNNASVLDSQSFTVFGAITTTTGSPGGLSLMTAINALPVFTETISSSIGTFVDIPLVSGYVDGAAIVPDNYVYVTSVAPVPVASALGIVDAASSARSLINGISPGELLTIYGQNGTLSSLGPTTGTTLTLDSSGHVSSTLSGTQVTFNGIAAPVLYSSAQQVNVVVPYGIAASSSATVVISYQGVQSAPFVFNVVPATPGILTLNSSGTGDAAIVRTNGSIVSASSPASPGDVLELYGEGQGVATPALPDGAIVGTTLPYPVAAVTLLIDGQTVQPIYAGGAPGDVAGVLQVNFVVPAQLAAGTHQIQIQSGTGSSAVVSPAGVTLVTH